MNWLDKASWLDNPLVQGLGFAGLGIGAYRGIRALMDAFNKPRPVDPYSGSFGYIGPNQLTRPDNKGNYLHYGYDKLGHHDAGRTWYDMQRRALDDYNYAYSPDSTGMNRVGQQTFRPGFINGSTGGIVAKPSLSSLMQPGYININGMGAK